MKKQMGFTLIELMIVVVIVAILAAVAVPSYQNSVMKTRRADAKEALTSAAALQERFFFSNNRYAENLGELGLNGTSSEGYYTVILGVPSNSKGGSKNTCETAGQEYPCFSMVASPVNPGPQVGDDQCGQLVVTQTGKKLSYANDNSTDTTDTCWK